MTDLTKIAPLFEDWQETMIWSCLDGSMGCALCDDENNPASAQIALGDLCFFAGEPNDELALKAGAVCLVPGSEDWCSCIERVWGERVQKRLRYAIKKEPDVFNIEKLTHYTENLPDGFSLCMFDEQLVRESFEQSWSRDFCAQFRDAEDFLARGIGVGTLYEGRLVAGASSFSVYRGGIEIEIDTKPEFRRQGLATACGAKLILECLSRGLYPSWDAYDLRSVSLAEKLGYHLDRPYVVYERLKEELVD
ncbi:MAG: GNAT family N-acetyltransferase [Clostridiaceae bacterium]